MTIPSCHPDRKHEARGLCKPCYENIRIYGNDKLRTEKRARDKAWHVKNFIPKPARQPKLIADCHPSQKNFARGMCQSCYGKWYRTVKFPSYHTYHNAKWRYGLTPEEHDMLLAKGTCDLCGCVPKTGKQRNLVIDHNHRTGATRGVLCRTCNSHLGWYENRQATIDEYLKKRRVIGGG